MVDDSVYLSLPGTEELFFMWKSLKQIFNSPDSYVSLALGLAVVLIIGMISFNYFKAKSERAQSQKIQQHNREVAKENAIPSSYTVKDGDTLWSIAEAYYKSGYNWVDIQNANTLVNADYIMAGQSLILPKITPTPQPTGQISAASTEIPYTEKHYSVVAGDDLWSISQKEYNGNGYRWVDIAKANHLTNPDIINAGNVLIVP